MAILLKHAKVIDPSGDLDDTLDILIEDSRIARVGPLLDGPAGCEVLDLTGLVAAPGFIDMHVHLRQPGKEDAETIMTGTQAAAIGGFTALACMPNTKPVNDNLDVTEFILKTAKEQGAVSAHPIAAVTKDEDGRVLNDLEALCAAGVVAFSDDGRPVSDSLLMRQALERASALSVAIIDHCEDPYLFRGGAMHEGEVSRRLGVRGIPAAAEEIMVSRNIHLARLTGGHVHMAHMSTAGSMRLIRDAKREGLRVTAEVTPHHFTLTDEAVIEHGANAKMNPPLRTAEDVSAVLDAIADGTVDVIASDHAPHTPDTKNVDLGAASFGIVGLETSVSLGLDRLVHSGRISLARFVELYSLNPARILRLVRGIREGTVANITVFDPNREITVDASQFRSKSRNTPFHGWKLKGAPMLTICAGRIAWKRS